MLKINVVELKGFKPAEEKLFREMMDYTEIVLNSEQFRQAVLNFKYSYYTRSWFKKVKKVGVRFAYCDKTNEEVYRMVMSGFDDKEGTDSEMDVIVDAYYANNGVVGSAYVGPHASNRRKWNKKFLGKIEDMAANLVHEYVHRLGLGHPFNSTGLRPYSAPYALGYIVRDLAKKAQAGQIELTPALGRFAA